MFFYVFLLLRELKNMFISIINHTVPIIYNCGSQETFLFSKQMYGVNNVGVNSL